MILGKGYEVTIENYPSGCKIFSVHHEKIGPVMYYAYRERDGHFAPEFQMFPERMGQLIDDIGKEK